MNSTRQWILNGNLLVVLVVGLFLPTIPAYALSSFIVTLEANLEWDPIEGIEFGPFAQPDSLNFETTTPRGSVFVTAEFDTGEGSGFLTTSSVANASVFPFPGGSAFAEAKAANLVRVENTQDTGTIHVDFEVTALWSALAKAENPSPDNKSRSVLILSLLKGSGPTPPFSNDPLLGGGATTPPDSSISGQDSESFSVPIAAGEVVWVGLEGQAAGFSVLMDEPSTPIPEPASILLFGSGMIGLGVWQWRRDKRNPTAL